MINQIIIYGLSFLVVTFGVYMLYQKRVNASLIEDNQHQADAIVAYEQILKVIPFEALGEERRYKANEEINNTIRNDDIISDNLYRL